ncbi:MAG: hypothetical protein HC854_13680 [Flavobacterium sp.]|nr:hypothetical protein [Flavobacterium sp.]
MKKVLIFIIGFLIVSCSKDDSCVSETNTSLVSITKKYYSNNNFTTSAKYNFYDNKLINILYSDGSYEDYQYNNNLVSRILKFNSNDSLFWTITYLYDSLGRIIEIKRIPSASNSQLQITAIYSFEYTLNQILITVNFSPGDTIKYQILLNQENKIIKEMVISINGNTVTELPYFSHIYLNGNLSESVETFLNLNNPIGQTKSNSYNDKKMILIIINIYLEINGKLILV